MSVIANNKNIIIGKFYFEFHGVLIFAIHSWGDQKTPPY